MKWKNTKDSILISLKKVEFTFCLILFMASVSCSNGGFESVTIKVIDISSQTPQITSPQEGNSTTSPLDETDVVSTTNKNKLSLHSGYAVVESPRLSGWISLSPPAQKLVGSNDGGSGLQAQIQITSMDQK